MTEASTAVLTGDLPVAMAPPAGQVPAVVTVVLPPDKAGAVDDLAAKFSVMRAEPHALVTFGQDAIGSFGVRLDDILAQITHAESPVLFELFRTIRDGVKDADLKDLETTIREKLKGSFVERLLLSVGLGDPARRLKKVSDEVRGMLHSKAKSLGDLVRPMEKQIETESGKLIGEVSRMSSLSQGYRDTIVSLGVYIEAGRRIAAHAAGDLAGLTGQASSGDPLKVQEARDAAQKLDLFQNRLLVLETAYAKAPADLDSIGIARGAALATLADTITSANAEFNDVKSILIRLHALFQMQSVQQMNAMRRDLRASLQHYGLQVLEEVSVGAAKASGETRLADADLVLGTARRLRAIADKVMAEGQRNTERYAQARAKLEAARQVVSDRPI